MSAKSGAELEGGRCGRNAKKTLFHSPRLYIRNESLLLVRRGLYVDASCMYIYIDAATCTNSIPFARFVDVYCAGRATAPKSQLLFVARADLGRTKFSGLAEISTTDVCDSLALSKILFFFFCMR